MLHESNIFWKHSRTFTLRIYIYWNCYQLLYTNSLKCFFFLKKQRLFFFFYMADIMWRGFVDYVVLLCIYLVLICRKKKINKNQKSWFFWFLFFYRHDTPLWVTKRGSALTKPITDNSYMCCHNKPSTLLYLTFHDWISSVIMNYCKKLSTFLWSMLPSWSLCPFTQEKL